MKVIAINTDGKEYSCNAYLVLGDSNASSSVNTLVDVGSTAGASRVIEQIQAIFTGIGKSAVEQVVLTHGHFDHAGGLPAIKDMFNPHVYAYERREGVDDSFHRGQILRMGDREFRVLHSPGHSPDSICLYCSEERVLFSGDTPVNIRALGGCYSSDLVRSLKNIAALRIDVIYSGHNDPIARNAERIIRATLDTVTSSAVHLEGS